MRSSCAGISFSCNHPPDPDVARCMTCWLFRMPLHRPIGSQEVQAWICVPNICKAEPWPFLRTNRRSTLKPPFHQPEQVHSYKTFAADWEVCVPCEPPASGLIVSESASRPLQHGQRDASKPSRSWANHSSSQHTQPKSLPQSCSPRHHYSLRCQCQPGARSSPPPRPTAADAGPKQLTQYRPASQMPRKLFTLIHFRRSWLTVHCPDPQANTPSAV